MSAGASLWRSEDYAANARFVSDLGVPVLDLLAPRAGERILDLGCGDGALTARIAAAGAVVVGVDSAPDMVAAARARELDAWVEEGAALPFEAAFDAVFSNAALHWMPEAEAVAAGIARALKPGGRFVAEFGGHGNVAAIRTALIAVLAAEGVATDLSEIWYFPTAQEYSAVLDRAGLSVREIALIPRPTRIDAGMEAWLTTLAAPVLGLIPQERRGPAAAAVAEILAPALRDRAGVWWGDYVRLRLCAAKGAAACGP